MIPALDLLHGLLHGRLRLQAAMEPQIRGENAKLLVIEASQKRFELARSADVESWLREGDVLVVNDAATLPASLMGTHDRTHAPIEMRLLRCLSPFQDEPRRWEALVFGSGDWRTPTENRAAPPALGIGDRLQFGSSDSGLSAAITHVDPQANRWIEIEFETQSSRLWAALYENGRPVQYAYLSRALELWDQQTVFAGPPVAIEPPSAAFALNWRLVFHLRARGVRILPLTHAAGLSSTGDAALDARLPLRERYRIPGATVAEIRAALKEGRRIIAVGTSVTRALESVASELTSPDLRSLENHDAIEGETDLRLSSTFHCRIVSGLLTGLHEPGVSHFDLLEAFAPRELLAKAYTAASTAGFEWHEYGDACLIVK